MSIKMIAVLDDWTAISLRRFIFLLIILWDYAGISNGMVQEGETQYIP